MSYENLIEAKIQIGDTVTIIFDEGDHEETMENAVVINTPDGTGDLWQFLLPTGNVFALNPYCYIFAGLVKEA